MKFFLSLVVIVTIGLAVSGCASFDRSWQGNQIVQSQAAQGIDGRWLDSEGVAFSTFYNGVFETRSVDTQEKLSEGNYMMTSANFVALEMRSLVRGTVSSVKCALSDYSKLRCTTEQGSQFTLIRQQLL